MNLKKIYYLHEIGQKKNQEDFIWPPGGSARENDKVFIVCDGVGGAENGEVASRIISEYVGEALQEMPTQKITPSIITATVENAKDELVKYVVNNKLNPDMATTVAILVLGDEKSLVAWSGDSRIYHVRNGEILYKTADHSLVNTLIRNGEITEEEAHRHPQKNIILKAIKADDTPVDIESEWLNDTREGDYFILCTDGLLENMDDEELLATIQQHEQQGTDLEGEIRKFNDGKTRDNYSMYILKTGAGVTIPKTRKRLLVPLVLAFVAISVFVYAKFFYPQKGSAHVTNSDSTTVLTKPPITGDTLSDFEVMATEDSDTLIPEASSSVIQQITDSSSADTGKNIIKSGNKRDSTKKSKTRF